MKEIETIIFDMDGTLVDSRQDIVNAVNYTLGRLGCAQKPFDEIVSYIGGGVRDLMEQSLGAGRDEEIKKAVGIFTDYYKVHSADTTTLYPGVRQTLEHFQAKKMLIVTNRTEAMAHVTLKALRIDHFFKGVVGGEDGVCLKPSACPLNKAFGTYAVSKEKSIIVGDMDVDVYAGKEAGILTCGVNYGIGKKDALVRAQPDYLIDDIAELKKLFR